MKKFPAFITSLLAITLLLPGRPVFADESDPGQVTIAVGQLLERDHYTKRKLDADLSKVLLKNYLESIDYNHLFFTQQDVDAFNDKYGTALGDDILLGNPVAAYDIWDVYTKRVEERVAKVKELLKENKFTFTSDRTLEIDRSKAPWPKDDAAADVLWHDRVEGELLQEKLLPHPIEPALKVLNRRYDQLLKNVHDETKDDQLKRFLDQLAQTYDPHSEYMSKDDLTSFNILMRNSLVGIGAVLQSDEGYAKIMDLVEGGPAKMSGKLKVGDRISAVAQGTDEFVDVIDMKLDKVVDLIRGKKGTTVRLKVISAKSTDVKIVEIVRDEVKLKEQDAKAELIEMPDSNGQPRRLGWIRLPAFYSDMEHPDSKSTTKDVLVLLNRLKQENISGLIVDLRNNGGGSLDEAVNLTGLFVKKGPVVQTRDSNDNVHISRCRDADVVYDGPLIILTNRLSASASEIFTAALQDYGRAVVVGDETTFGKGTVQTLISVARVMAPPFGGGGSEDDAGALKLTIQKFYRIAGGSTQLHGVTSDVVIPSIWDIPQLYGEGALKGPLPYDVVDAATYDKVTDHPLFISELKQRSAARVAANPEFGYVTDDLARIKKKLADNTISLNEKARRAEDAADKERNDKRTAARAKRKAPEEKDYEITLDNADKPDLQPVKNDIKPAVTDPDGDESPDDDPLAPKKPVIDPQRNETLNILNDLIDLSKPTKTADVEKPADAAKPAVTQ